MTSITSSLPVYTPLPVNTVDSAVATVPVSNNPLPAPTSNGAAPNDQPQSSVQATPPVQTTVPTNANTNTPAIYTALANESASTIRGTNLNATV